MDRLGSASLYNGLVGAAEIRRDFLNFYVERGHVQIARSNLVPREDPTTLFTGSGMQPLIPYLLGAPNPAGSRLVDSQVCFRAEDIDEVGDSRHTTLFEMLGNWSLGDYFKTEQLPWVFEFLTRIVKLDPARLYVSAFAGSPKWEIPRDEESVLLWTELLAGAGQDPVVVEAGTKERASAEGIGDARIVLYDESQCWWSRSGPPHTMPVGEPGGPDSEIFYLFAQVPHDPAYGAYCHPHCDCGRFVEIGNSVFMQYRRTADGFEELPKPNVDFGGGLERIAMAQADTADAFDVDLLAPIVSAVRSMSTQTGVADDRATRIITDHARAVVFLALDGVEPSNNTQGYVMRRFARRAIRQGLTLGIESDLLSRLVDPVVGAYGDAYPDLVANARHIRGVLEREENLFRRTLARGVKELPKIAGSGLTGDSVFALFDTYGFPPELSVEEAASSGIPVDPDWRPRYDELMAEQKQRSRTAAAGMFKGGLADRSEATTRLHTATHLLYKALRLVLGDHVVQRGSNITPERLRFDFSHPQKVTPEEIAKVEDIVNQNISHDWQMNVSEMSPEQAFTAGALGAFGDKYGPSVTVYTAGDPDDGWYSKEICGGPHVAHTGELGHFRVVKEESSSAGVRRIRAVLE
ncbi:MAG: alanine--tRNA ligase [Acidimicrobiales bacterium]